MKKASKKIIGGFMVVMLIATIGAVITSAQGPHFNDLTDEQKQEMKDLKQSLLDEGKTKEEIREEMQNQFEGYGIDLPTQEEMIDKKIEIAEQKLEILQRIQELVEENPEITKEEIKEEISEEFELELPEEGKEMKYRHKGRCGYGLKSK